jgi:hypothetical protein
VEAPVPVGLDFYQVASNGYWVAYTNYAETRVYLWDGVTVRTIIGAGEQIDGKQVTYTTISPQSFDGDKLLIHIANGWYLAGDLAPTVNLEWASAVIGCGKRNTSRCHLKALANLTYALPSTAKVKCAVQLYLSQDNQLDQTDTPIGKTRTVKRLHQGQPRLLRLNAKLPAGTTPTGMYILAKLTPVPGTAGTVNTSVYGPLPLSNQTAEP